MKRSKLVLHLEILKALNEKIPLSPTQIMYEVNICYRFLEQYLDFLVKQNLVEKKVSNKMRAMYTITQKGLDLLRNYAELGEILQLGGKNKTKECLGTLAIETE